MQRERRSALKVGLFVLLGLAITAAILIGIRDWQVFRSGYELQVTFDSASGLSVGAPVQYAGVDVGEVRRIRILPRSSAGAPQVELSLWIRDSVTVRQDDRVIIGLLGLLGEKYVEIQPGPGTGAVVPAGGTLQGAETISELQIAEQLSHLVEQLSGSIDQIEAFVGRPAVRSQWEHLLSRSEQLAAQASQSMQRADRLTLSWTRVGDELAGALESLDRWFPWALASILAIPLLLKWLGT